MHKAELLYIWIFTNALRGIMRPSVQNVNAKVQNVTYGLERL